MRCPTLRIRSAALAIQPCVSQKRSRDPRAPLLVFHVAGQARAHRLANHSARLAAVRSSTAASSPRAASSAR